MTAQDNTEWVNEAEILRRAQLERARAVDAMFARLAAALRRRLGRPAKARTEDRDAPVRPSSRPSPRTTPHGGAAA